MGSREPHARASLRSAKSGSLVGFEELFRANWPHAYRTAFLIVHDEAAAEDIAQEAFLAAIRSLDRFDRRRPFTPWLHRIVVNRAIDWTRSRSSRREVVGAHAVEASAPEQDQSGEVYSEDLMGALRSLSAEQRAVIVLRHLLDYSPGEIAAMLDLPRGTINSRLRRGLDLLRSDLEGPA